MPEDSGNVGTPGTPGRGGRGNRGGRSTVSSRTNSNTRQRAENRRRERQEEERYARAVQKTARAIDDRTRATAKAARSERDFAEARAETYEEFVKQQEEEKKLLQQREKWQEQYDQDQIDQARRTVRQKNAILYDSKDFMQYSNTVRSLQEKNAKQSIANFEKQYDEYLKLTKAHAKEIGDIQEKQNATNLKFMKKYYQGRIDIVEKNFVKETETIQKGLEDIRDYVEGDFYDTFEDSIKDVVEQFTGLEDQTESTMEKLRDNFSKTFGDDEDGLVGQITSAINQLSSIDLLNGFNLNNLVNEISSSDSDWGKFRNESQNQYGITPEQLEAWASGSLNYVNDTLNGKFDFAEVQGLMEQMRDAGITQQDQRDTYTEPLLSAIGALDVDMSSVSKFLQFDMDRGMSAELLTDTAADLNMAIQSQQYQGLNTNKAFEELSEMLSGAVQLGSRNGVNISNESLMSLNTALSAGLASMSGLTMGGESEEAFKSVMNAIMSYDPINNPESIAAFRYMGLNAEGIRNAIVNGSAEEQRNAVAEVINSMVNASRNGAFNQNNPISETLRNAGLISEALTPEALSEMGNALANKTTEDALKTNFNDYFKLAAEGDKSTLDNYTKSIMKVPMIDSTLNKLTNSFQSSSMGQAIREWFSDLGGTLSGALEPLFIIKNLLMGGNDGILSWLGGKIFGKGGGGGGLASTVAEVGGGLGGATKGGGILSKLGSLFSGGGKAGKIASPLASSTKIAGFANDGSELAQLWMSESTKQQGIFSKLWNRIINPAEGSGTGFFQGIKNLFSRGAGTVKNVAVGAKNGVSNFIGGEFLEEGGEGFLTGIKNFFTGQGKPIDSGLLGKMSSGMDDLIANGGATKVISTAGKALPGIMSAMQGIMEGVEGVQKTKEWFQGDESPEAQVSSFLGSFIAGAGDGIKKGDFWENLAEIGGNALKGAGAGAALGSFIPGLGTAVGGVIGGIGGAISGAIGGDTLAQWFKPVTDWVGDTYDAFMQSNLGKLVKGVADKLGEAANWLGGIIDTALKPAVDAAYAWAQELAEKTPKAETPEEAVKIAEDQGAVRKETQGTKAAPNTQNQKLVAEKNTNSQSQALWGANTNSASSDYAKQFTDAYKQNKSAFVRGYANGLSEVPYDEYPAVLHKGEAVLTANQAEQVRADGGIDIQESLTKAFQTSQNDALRNFVYENNTGTQNGMSLYDAVFKIYNTLQTYANKSLSSQQVISNKISSLATNKTYGGTTVATVSKITSPQTTPTTIQHDPDTRLNKSETTPKDETGKTTTTTTTTTTTPKVPSSTDLHDPEKRANSYAVGTPYVPNDQLALIHQGEMVVPKEFNPYANASSVMPYNVDNGDVVQIIQWLGSTLTRKLDEVEGVIQSSTPRTVPGQRGTTMSDIAFSL